MESQLKIVWKEIPLKGHDNYNIVDREKSMDFPSFP